MIELVDGAVYSVAEENLTQEMLEELCTKGHENDVICAVRKKWKQSIHQCRRCEKESD